MALERDLEMLDDYLANRLDGDARAAFEKKLSTDPDLKSEFELQQQFINGIKKARIAELKSILNNVPVPSIQPDGTAVASKIALWTVVAGIVGTGIYFYFQQEDTKIGNTPETTIEQPKQAPESEASEEDPLKSHDNPPVVSEEPSSSEQKPAQSPESTKKGKDNSQEKAQEPAIEVFDPTKEDERSGETEPVSGEEVPKLDVDPAIDVEIDSQNKKYNFHYQFKQGKLFLYGPFEKNLYEIMEFFSDNKRTIFLYHSDKYYLLKDDSEKLRSLDAIKDTVLIQKLKDYRK